MGGDFDWNARFERSASMEPRTWHMRSGNPVVVCPCGKHIAVFRVREEGFVPESVTCRGCGWTGWVTLDGWEAP